MAGYRGKRAKSPSPCKDCGTPIRDAVFMRERDGDYHESCWIERFCPALKRDTPPSIRELSREGAK